MHPKKNAILHINVGKLLKLMGKTETCQYVAGPPAPFFIDLNPLLDNRMSLSVG